MKQHWLITSGPTQAPLDAFRILTNRSTGTFGTLLAKKLLRLGQDVTMIYGEGSKTPTVHRALKLICIRTNKELELALKKELKNKYHAIIHAAAILDFISVKVPGKKVKTKNGNWSITLTPTPKIINKIKRWSPQTQLVAFKLEFGFSKSKLLSEARRVQKQCRADFMVANELEEGADPKHKSYLLDRRGNIIGNAKGKEALVTQLVRIL